MYTSSLIGQRKFYIHWHTFVLLVKYTLFTTWYNCCICYSLPWCEGSNKHIGWISKNACVFNNTVVGQSCLFKSFNIFTSVTYVSSVGYVKLNFVGFIFFKCVMVTFCSDRILNSFHSDIRFQIWFPDSCDRQLLIISCNSRSSHAGAVTAPAWELREFVHVWELLSFVGSQENPNARWLAVQLIRMELF